MTEPTLAIIRPLVPRDLAAVERIQSEAYPHYPCERIEVFADKLARYPAGCFAFDVGGEMGGYLFSHPILIADPPKFDAQLSAPPSLPDGYFIHDKAVAPTMRGRNAGRLLLEAALAHAAACGFSTLALVSVQGSRGYWERHGFTAVADDNATLASVRLTYGPQAYYMLRRAVATAD